MVSEYAASFRDIFPPLAAALLAALVSLTPGDLVAASFYMPGRGVQPMGRAGASVASGGGNLNSIWYNPANLAPLEERTLTVDTAVIGTFSTFHRAPRTRENGSTQYYDPVSNQALPTPNPQILVGGPTPLEGLSWAAGMWAPYASFEEYPKDGAQRYTTTGRTGSVVSYFGASLGYEVSDSLRLGLGFQNMVTDVKLTTVVSGYSGLYGRPEDRSLDNLARLRTKDLFVPTGNLGVWYKINESFQAAASVQIPTRVQDDNAKVKVRKGSHPSFDEAKVEGNTVSAGLNVPIFLRGALRYTADEFDLELAAVFEGWSVVHEPTVDPHGIEVKDVPGVGDVPLEPITIPRHWRDSISLRLGGDYQLSEDWTARAGYAFETSAIPDEYYDVLVNDAPKHVISGGFSYAWNDKLSLDGAATLHAYHTREVTNSRARQIAPMDVDNEHATAVGNGIYRTAQLAVGAGVNWKF
jgi:long-chain fatty acid transport protein